MLVTLFIVMLALFLLGIATLWWAFRVEPHHPRASTHRISVSAWPVHTTLRILQLSDLHLWGLTPLHQRLLAQVAELRPDIIAVTGDYAESGQGLQALSELMSRLRAIAPVYAVMGDNDQENPDWQRKLETVFARADVTVLHNEARLLHVGDEHLVLAGTDDPNTGLSRADKVHASAKRLLQTAQVQAGQRREYTVVLAHSPEIVVSRQPWMDLILTGHTHGGQICLPGGKALYTNTPACKGYASGMYRLSDGTLLYVHRGVGTARIPARLFCPPEVALFELIGTSGRA